MKIALFTLTVLMASAVMSTFPQANATDEIPSEVMLFKNVNIFDGKSGSRKWPVCSLSFRRWPAWKSDTGCHQ